MSEIPETGADISSWVQLFRRERIFLTILMIGFLVSALTYQTPQVAMWVGFLFAGYSAVANDSIQTIGTFIASNGKRPWWVLWAYIAGIFIVTMIWSWIAYDGDVSFGRLGAKGFETAPTSFEFLHVSAPLFLMILTRLKMPVSTTFLLLSSFASVGKGISDMLIKSVVGYGIAFACAIAVWLTLGPIMKRRFVGEAHPAWRVLQWFASGSLWAAWLAQDAANIAVYLPRQLNVVELLVFIGAVVAGLGLLFWQGGERIQQVVNEKSHVVDVRAAAVIDIIYGAILWIFMKMSNVPMSTTWVFVGLLGGRELAMALRGAGEDGRGIKDALKMMGRDLLYVIIGFTVALIIAAASNPVIKEALFK